MSPKELLYVEDALGHESQLKTKAEKKILQQAKEELAAELGEE